MSAPPGAADRVVRFPPGWGTALIPERPRRASAQATMLYTACRPVPLLAQQVVWAAARIGGARLLPGRREAFTAPLPTETFEGLYRDWVRAAGGQADGLALHRRVQPSRPSAVLLLCAGPRSLLLRVRRNPRDLDKERRISEAAARLRPRSFRVPALRAEGERDGWHWVGYEVIARRPHWPVRSANPELFAEITELVESALSRPADVPRSWCGCHGDLTPWNLRRSGRATWLIDWEDAGWAPEGADLVYFTATAATLGRRPRGLLRVAETHAEATRYWRAIVDRRETVRREDRLQQRLSTLLGSDPPSSAA